MFKKITIISICILIIVSIVMTLTVNAEEVEEDILMYATSKTYDYEQIENINDNGVIYYFPYVNNSFDYCEPAIFKAEVGYYLVFFPTGTRPYINGKTGQLYGTTMVTKWCENLETAQNYLFGDIPFDLCEFRNGGYFWQTVMASENIVFGADGKYTGSSGDPSIVTKTLTEFYIEYRNEHPLDPENCSHLWEDEILKNPTCFKTGLIKRTCQLCGTVEIYETPVIEHEFENGSCKFCGYKEYEDGVLGWFQKLFDKISEIPEKLLEVIEAIKGIFKVTSGGIVFDTVGELVNDNLVNNKFYTSVTKVKDTLTSLFSEDYSSRTGFYELDLPFNNFSLGKIQGKVYKDFGNDTIGKWEQEYNTNYGTGIVDWGLNNVKLINLDWFFGKQYADGYYTKGVKDYSDKIIGSFMWLVFGWWLWHNLPDLMMGEIGNVSSLTNTRYTKSENTTKTKTKKEDKKE